MNATTYSTLLAASAALVLTAAATTPATASAAWFDAPEISATVSPGLVASDPHYINLSEDGKFLLVD